MYKVKRSLPILFTFEVLLAEAVIALVIFIFFFASPSLALHTTSECVDTSPGACGPGSPGATRNFTGFSGQPGGAGGSPVGGSSGYSTSGSCTGWVQVSASRNPLNPNSAFEAQVSGLQQPACAGRAVTFSLSGGGTASCTLSSFGNCSALMRSPGTAGTYTLSANVAGIGPGSFTLYVHGNADATGTSPINPNGGYNFTNWNNYNNSLLQPQPTGGTTPGQPPGGQANLGSCSGTVGVSASRNPVDPGSRFDVSTYGVSCSGQATARFTIGGSQVGVCAFSGSNYCSSLVQAPSQSGLHTLTATVYAGGSVYGTRSYNLSVSPGADAGQGSPAPGGGYIQPSTAPSTAPVGGGSTALVAPRVTGTTVNCSGERASIVINWTGVAGENGYGIFGYQQGAMTTFQYIGAAGANATSFTWNNALSNVSSGVYVRVSGSGQSVDSERYAFNTSCSGGTGGIQPGGTTPPGGSTSGGALRAPDRVTASVVSCSSGFANISVNWFDNSQDETGFEVHKWQNGDGGWDTGVARVGANVQSQTISVRANELTGIFVAVVRGSELVHSQSISVQSTCSSGGTVTPPGGSNGEPIVNRPSAPVISIDPQCAGSSVAVHVTWGAVQGATSYQLFTWQEGDSGWRKQGGDIPAGTTSQRWLDAKPDVQSGVYVVAVNSAGNAPSAAKTFTKNCGGTSIGQPPTGVTQGAAKPIAPGKPTATVTSCDSTNANITLSWTDNSDNEDKFTVSWWQQGVGGWREEHQLAAGRTSDTLTLKRDQLTGVFVTAVNSAGEAYSPSNTFQSTCPNGNGTVINPGTGTSKPGAPTNLLEAVYSCSNGQANMSITWTSGGGQDYYQVYKWQEPSGTETMAWTLLDGHATGTNVSWNGAVADKLSGVYVVAVNAVGGTTSATRTFVPRCPGSPGGSPPTTVQNGQAPSAVTLTGSCSGATVSLNWTGGANATRFQIFESRSGQNGWNPVGTTSGFSFSWQGLANTQHGFYVEATNAAVNGTSIVPTASNVITVVCSGSGGGNPPGGGDFLEIDIYKTGGGVRGVKTSIQEATQEKKRNATTAGTSSGSVLQATSGPIGLRVDSVEAQTVGQDFLGAGQLCAWVTHKPHQGHNTGRFVQEIFLTGGDVAVTASGMPAGLQINGNCLDGTPSQAGQFTVSFSARSNLAEDNGASDTQGVSFTVNGASNRDTTPPETSIVSPTNGQRLQKGTIRIVGNSNAHGDLRTNVMSFYVDNNLVGEKRDRNSSTLFYEFDWNASSALGDHTIKVEAEDNNGNKGTSQVSISVIEATYDPDPSQATKPDIMNYIYSKVGNQTITVQTGINPETRQPIFETVNFGKFLWGMAGCESTWGTNNSGSFHGVFQYIPTTWKGGWDAQRLSAPSTTDVYAQIDLTIWIMRNGWNRGFENWPNCAFPGRMAGVGWNLLQNLIGWNF